MKVTLISCTPEPEKTVAAAARLCYSPATLDDLMEAETEDRTTRFLEMLSDLGHASPTEHASFTFGIEGVSRALLAQITRHRIASFSVQSQRYVNESGFDYVVPPAVAAIPEAAAAFHEAMERAQQSYDELTALLTRGYERENGSGDVRKAIEDARFVLPNACATKMMVTMNARSLHNFFALRCCERAQWEIRALADEMLRLVLGAAPHLFAKAGPGCLFGPCPEGRMCCGKTHTVRKKYAILREGAL